MCFSFSFCFRLSRDLHENLLVTRRKVMDHGTDQRYRMMQQVSEMASMARSILHKKRRQNRPSATRPSQPTVANNSQDKPKINSQDAVIESSGIPVPTKASDSSENARKLPLGITLEVFRMISHSSQGCSHLITCLENNCTTVTALGATIISSPFGSR